jgi:hypothetical protein
VYAAFMQSHLHEFKLYVPPFIHGYKMHALVVVGAFVVVVIAFELHFPHIVGPILKIVLFYLKFEIKYLQ